MLYMFSCCGNWVDIAKKGFGKGQGDKYEGVFAKSKKRKITLKIKLVLPVIRVLNIV